MDRINNTLDDIASLIGYSATSRLVAWFGGSNIYVPRYPDDNNIAVKLIGINNVLKLSREWGGELLNVPADNGFDDDVRNAMIARMIARKFTPREIARSTGLSERRVQQVKKMLENVGIIEGGENLAEAAPKNEG